MARQTSARVDVGSEVQKDSQACEQTVAQQAVLIEATIPKYLC